MTKQAQGPSKDVKIIEVDGAEVVRNHHPAGHDGGAPLALIHARSSARERQAMRATSAVL